LFSRIIVFVIIANFILTCGPVGNVLASNGLRQSAALKTLNPGRDGIIDDLHADLHARAQAIVARLPEGSKVDFHKYDKGKGGYVVERIDKKNLAKLLARDEIGLIEDEDNPGQYIWANKVDGAVLTKNGELFISNRITYPTMTDVPINRIDLPLYTKVFPLAYWFFNTYLGKGEYAWISDILSRAKVLLVAPGSLGNRHFSADRATKTIKIEKDFMDYILIGGQKQLLGRGVFGDAAAGQKRVGMGLFTEAAIAISDNKIAPGQAKEIVNKIAQISLTGKNRLEDAIYLFNLKKEIAQKERKLTPQERQYFLIDMMERNRGFNGRLAAKVLKETFEYYGEVTTEEAEADLRAIAQAHPDGVIIDKYDRDHETEEEKAAKYADRTDTFRLSGKHLADLSLIKDRRIVWDYEIDARDAPLFGGKVAYTGMMQWAPRVLTLPMFATAGVCFKEDLIKYNDYKEEFEKIAKELKDGLETLNKQHNQNFIGDEEFAREKAKLVRGTAGMFQSKLDWGVAKISPELVKEIEEALTLLAKRTGTSLFQLILAIRSSAIGEDSETASFAGRQDTSLFVTILTEEFTKIGLKPEDYGYTWEDLKRSVFPWYDILNKARAKLGDRVVTEQMLEVFVREWLANQRSLFNTRSIEYRLENNIPVFTDQVEMSSIFQEQANTEFGYVAFGVNRATGYPEIQIELIEGQTNPLVDGSGTGDLVFVGYSGRDRFRAIQVPESRKTMHVPNIFGKAIQVEGETRKGGVISIDFPEELKGVPAITDEELLTQMGEVDAELTSFFGMYPDIEGGLVIRRDKKGNILFAEDILEPDGIAKDRFGKPRMLTIKFQTQIRPDATYNFKNPDVIEQHWLEVPDEEYQRAVRDGKVLYGFSQAHTQGAAKGEVFILEKGRPDTWYKALKKVMVTVQSDPDMNEAMRSALAVVAAVGG
ncbi:MAG: PEP/pyruvate-binding domain-containing protein, partial [Candidatus Omnitrophica bacterium]|nr:PEP/pyruvate-binding domain-containing protein [Candidatus Omnitrophota bacterium]